MNSGTAPAPMTVFVWSAVPDAIFVSAHAASNYVHEVKSCMKWSTQKTYLQHRIIAAQELHKSRYNTALDDALNRGILLF